MVKLKPGAEYLGANRRFSEALLMLIDHALESGLKGEAIRETLETALEEGPEGLEERIAFLMSREHDELLREEPAHGTA